MAVDPIPLEPEAPPPASPRPPSPKPNAAAGKPAASKPKPRKPASRGKAKRGKPKRKPRRRGFGALAHAFFARGLPAAAVIAGVAAVAVAGLAFTRAATEREIFRERLGELSDSYGRLLGRYNDAVRQTAVTELVVEGGSLSVSVRNAEGEIATVDTPFDPRREIYVDYAVIDGRVWIRRVFDAATPPSGGVPIDPALADIDWDDGRAQVGKTVYRTLGEGRWVVSVSGNVGLGLRRAEPEERVTLAPPPTIEAYEEIAAEADAAARNVGLRDVLERVLGW